MTISKLLIELTQLAEKSPRGYQTNVLVYNADWCDLEHEDYRLLQKITLDADADGPNVLLEI